jgi:predicted XRE-type DNA-binding protein
MTELRNRNLVKEYAATDLGAQELAVVDLTSQVARIIDQAIEASPLDQRALASKLGVTESRVSQVVNSDGNLRVAAVARYLHALGYSPQFSAAPLHEGLPPLPKSPVPRGRRKSGRGKVGGADEPYVFLVELPAIDDVSAGGFRPATEDGGRDGNDAAVNRLYIGLPPSKEE